MKSNLVCKYILISLTIFLLAGCAIFGSKERERILSDEISLYEQEGDGYFAIGDYEKP